MAITPPEAELMDMLIAIEDNRDFVLPISIYASQTNRTEEILEYVKQHPGVGHDDVMLFTFPYDSE